MKITKIIEDKNTTHYFYNGVKKYTHFKDSDGYERWSEYDKNGKETHFKDSDGYEWWSEYDKNGNEIYFKDSDGYERRSDDNPDNPKKKNKIDEIKPFQFGK